MASADFDHIAQSYDEEFSNSLIGKAQRKLVWNILNEVIPSFQGLKILEFNCGTGVDAALMASKGANVLATDISQKMIEIADRKLEDYPDSSAEVIDIRSIENLKGQYDLIFSNFGGLNCLNETELLKFVNSATKNLKPQGKVVLVIMPKNTLWETFYFFTKLSPTQACRRWTKNSVRANVEGKMVDTYYHNPAIFRDLEGLEVETVSPIGLFVPPSYLEARFREKPLKIERYYNKDSARVHRSRLARFADHYCIVLKKR